MANYLDPLRIALRINDQRNHAYALIFCPACFVGELGIRSKHKLRSRNAAAYVVNPATVPAACARSVTISFARTDATARTCAHTSSAAAPVGSRTDHAGARISQVRQVVVGELDVLGHHDRGINGQFRVIVLDHHGWGDRLLLEL